MPQTYYTYRMCITDDCKSVQVQKLSPTNENLGIPMGKFLLGKNKKKIEEKLQLVINNKIDLESTRDLGEILFNSLFDAPLAQDFLNFRYEVVRKERQLLRVELDINERKNPHIVALPWEFLRIPQHLDQETAWLATDSNLVFSRRRQLWNPALPIKLQPNEKLRIGLAIASPKDLGTVLYEDIEKELGELAKKLPEQIELLPIVKNANALAINDLLEQKPHIFHFIGHGQLDNNQGKIALENKIGKALWLDAQSFSELFNVHHPAVVLLQACEGGMSSNSEAFVSVAAKIVSYAIPVVVAMQYPVSNLTATNFVEEFYKELGKGEPVDIAVQKGRNQIYLSDVQSPGRDFATPVLFMNVRDGYLFDRDELKKNFLDTAIDDQPSTLLDENNQLNWDQIPFDIIQTAYRESLPPSVDFWDFNRVEEIIKYLKKCQLYDQFLINLSKKQNLPVQIYSQLNNLVQSNPLGDNTKSITCLSKDEEYLRSYLILTIKPSPEKDNFFVSAWLVENDRTVDNPVEVEFKNLINNENQFKVSYKLNEIPNLLNDLLEEVGNILLFKKHILTIELFLPIDLIYEAVDQWKINDPRTEDLITLGAKYPIRLRLLERLKPRYLGDAWSDWSGQWKRLRIYLEQETPFIQEIFENINENDDYCKKMLDQEFLDNLKNKKVGLKIACVNSPEKTQQLLRKVILKITTPLAIWTRYFPANLESEIDKILFTQPLNKLCESIRIAREKADICGEQHLGNNLALLWENPYRLTPDAISKFKIPGQ
jgi:hypothetical protein